MDTMYIGPFSAPDIDTIHRALKAQLDNLDAFLQYRKGHTNNYFLEEKNRLGRIIEKIETVKLSQ